MARNIALTWDPAPSPLDPFPLAVSASGRYLQTPTGTPHRLTTEFAWMLSTHSTSAEVDTYLANRAARGINGFELMAVVADLNEAYPFDWSRQNTDGDEPFTTVGDLSTPNPVYWAKLDTIIDRAAALGMAVLLYPLYVGYGGGASGWWSVVAANSQANCESYGAFIGDRYKDRPNVIWMFGGDYTLPNDGTRTKYVAFVNALRGAGALQIAGSEWGPPDTLVTDQAGFTYGTNPSSTHMQLDSFYACGAGFNGRVYGTADRSWTRVSPVLPGFACETMMCDGTYVEMDSSRPATRKYYNHAATSGAVAGVNMGQVDMSMPMDMSKLNEPCFDDYRHHIALFKTLASYHLMRPSGTASVSAHGASGSTEYCGRLLIVSGGGSGDSLITASQSDDGTEWISYVPPTGMGVRVFNADLRSMAGAVTFTFYDPTTGVGTPVAPAANTEAAFELTTPSADRDDESDDWIVIGRVMS